MYLLYAAVEAAKLQLTPARYCALMAERYLKDHDNPFYDTQFAQTMRAAVEMTERLTRNYTKPEFGIKETIIDGRVQKVEQVTVLSKIFCNLIHFKKPGASHQPKLLIVAPMSGHHATLLRDTVATLLHTCDVYITDWISASEVPLTDGSFDMDDYIDYVIEFINFLGDDVHVMAVCQPTVPVLAAVSIMSAEHNNVIPRSMILIGGPVDARKSPTLVNNVATTHDIQWFKDFVISTVPADYPGFGRRVYPGFLQLAGFVSMKWEAHLNAHIDLFKNLLIEENAMADKQKAFYDEYFAVMDLTEEFYIQTMQEVFQKFSLAKGCLVSRGRAVNLSNIKHVALLGIEGEHDDIAGIGQTQAAFALCSNIPDTHKHYHLQKDVGHYGVFSGSKFRQHVAPVIQDFIYKVDAHSVDQMSKSIARDKSQQKAPAKRSKKS
jgi:poly(3-hydroxybutyrate) depolymerase